MNYRLYAPTWSALMEQAARLRRLDDDAVTAADGTAKIAEQARRLADTERAHASRSALPPKWRCRDKTKSQQWPSADDPDLWRALGASHALAFLTPSLQPADTPYSIAYTQGYTAIMGAYMMPNQQHEPTISRNIVALAASRHQLSESDLGNYMLTGDVTLLSKPARAQVLVAMAIHVGLDPLERPFMLMQDGKRTVIYARAACADGLCRERNIGTELVSVEEVDVCGTRQIVASAKSTITDTGLLTTLLGAGADAATALMCASRSKTAVGAVAVLQPETEWNETAQGKKYKTVTGWREPTPDEASNLWMKATTKAERRAVLKLVGLGGVVDESELETIDPANNGLHYTIEQVVEPDQGEPSAEPLCVGKGKPIADANRVRRAEYANRTGTQLDKVWGSVLRALGLENGMPEPEQLTITQGKAAGEKLKQALARLDDDAPDSEPIDHAEGAGDR